MQLITLFSLLMLAGAHAQVIVTETHTHVVTVTWDPALQAIVTDSPAIEEYQGDYESLSMDDTSIAMDENDGEFEITDSISFQMQAMTPTTSDMSTASSTGKSVTSGSFKEAGASILTVFLTVAAAVFFVF
jgi:hypothetical protein